MEVEFLWERWRRVRESTDPRAPGWYTDDREGGFCDTECDKYVQRNVVITQMMRFAFFCAVVKLYPTGTAS